MLLLMRLHIAIATAIWLVLGDGGGGGGGDRSDSLPLSLPPSPPSGLHTTDIDAVLWRVAAFSSEAIRSPH